ncbi:MAG: zinc-dependent metalloprotease [Acidimicrobiia bacterium]|jgi:putative hydrolase|nr:zinc-dependent metalloprotease [Acidimicrobiia bacterium]MBA3982300.1 zinc-dependent metalloprotease [Acidimicrobiia bacterium]MDQ3391642.1 zinc-dependent metalloprotease [Actinomycetota bacterium]
MAEGSTPDRGADDDNPFQGIPMFSEIAKAMAGQGPLNWDAARQFALMAAAGGESEPNVDPAVRLAYGDLSRIAAMHVADVTGSELDPPELNVVTRAQWATQTLDAYRHLFTEMATSLGRGQGDAMSLFEQDPDEPDGPGAEDPMFKMLAGFNKLMAPALMGMSVGSMVGSLARRAFGIYDLPIPRQPRTLSLVATTIDQFASDWSLERDEMRLWVVTHELTGHALFSAPHISERVAGLARRHAGAFRPDPSAITDTLGGVNADDNPIEALQRAFSDPEILLGAVRSPEQHALAPELDAAVAVVVGYLDWVVDAVSARVVGGDALSIAEAVRRRRTETSREDVFVERLLGIRLGVEQVTRGKAFVQGVVDRGGEAALTPLLARSDSFPTPNEVDAPGLWLARLEHTDPPES